MTQPPLLERVGRAGAVSHERRGVETQVRK
jgi:hypothetical protein